MIVENEYKDLKAMVGAIDGVSFGSTSGRSLHLNSKTFQYSGRIIVYYDASNTGSYLPFTINDEDRFLVIDLENYFDSPGHHVYNVVTEVKDGVLVMDLEVDVVHCDDIGDCFIAEKRIQEFRCKINRATLNGVELDKGVQVREDHERSQDVNDIIKNLFGNKGPEFYGYRTDAYGKREKVKRR